MKADEKRGRMGAKKRSQGLCEVHLPGICLGWGHSIHHRKNRSQGGNWDISNLLHVCGDGVRGCHGWITENPKASYKKGWAVKGCWRSDEVPVLLAHDTEPVLLSDDGSFHRPTKGERP